MVTQATVTLKGTETQVKEYYPYDTRDEECEDLVQMVNVDPPNMLNTLRKRHELGISPYSNVGQESIVISLNPYRWFDIYKPELMLEYYHLSAEKELGPHVFAIAAQAYRALCVTQASQSIVTSGESGSGKTENTKQVFRFLAEIAGKQAGGGGVEASIDVDDVSHVGMEQILLHSNPVLESFGNAKTVRNDNSSRFGKLVKVHFDGWGRIIGSHTSNYLLEKTRVTTPEKGERGYHIFYMLLAGLSADEKKARKLKDLKSYAMLTRSGCTTVDGLDDKKEWGAMLDAMNALGIGATEQKQIFDISASVLHLTSVRFKTDKSAAFGDNASSVEDPTLMQTVAELLEVEYKPLLGAMTSYKIREQRAALSVEKAEKNRDAFAKAVHSVLFDWLVQRINLAASNRSLEGTRFIGVLDIFGFEIFRTNSLEQLCINYANEKLQANFTTTVFKNEEGMYSEEGIAFTHIPYADNTPVLELIEGVKGRGGIIPMLEEESKLPNTTDKTLLDKLNAKFADGKHPRYSTHFKTPTVFTIVHYAGDVVYNPFGDTKDDGKFEGTLGFLEKSVDNISPELISSLRASAAPIVSSLFEVRAGGRIGPKEGQSRKPTVGTEFAKELNHLVALLESTQSHFIRCVKPNALKSPTAFDAQLSLEQLTYSGVFEAVQIRKQGYPFRRPHTEFYFRFKELLPSDAKRSLSDDKAQMRQNCEAMIKALPTCPRMAAAIATAGLAGADAFEFGDDVKVGKSKIFYRPLQSRVLEIARETLVMDKARLFQRFGRATIARGVKRRLRATKEALAAAMAAKDLPQLEAAIEATHTKQVAFCLQDKQEFTLFVGNQKDVDLLHADLVEELRCNDTLGTLVQADQLGQNGRLGADMPGHHGLFKAEHEGLGLPSAHSETWPLKSHGEGVALVPRPAKFTDFAAFDHVCRRTTSTPSTIRSSRSSRLPRSCARSSGGRSSRSHPPSACAGCVRVYSSTTGSGWRPPSRRRPSCILPISSRSRSRRRASRSRSSRCLCPSPSALASPPSSLPSSSRLTPQPSSAAPPRSKGGLAIENQMLSDLAHGASKYEGAGKWSHAAIDTSALEKSLAEALAFPLISKQGTNAIKQAQTCIALRTAIKADDWAAVSATLKALKPEEHVSSCEEVEAARRELLDAHTVKVRVLEEALAQGRSTRAGAGAWERGGMATKPLIEATDALAAFPHETDASKLLLAQAAFAATIRKELMTACGASAASWAGLCAALDGADRLVVANLDEAKAAQQELDDKREATEKAVSAALASGRAVKSGAKWSHESVTVQALTAALTEAEAFPKMSDAGRLLAKHAAFTIKLREALQGVSWDVPPSFREACELLNSPELPPLEASGGDCSEYKEARREIDDKRQETEDTLTRELGRCRSVRSGDLMHGKVQRWDHSAIGTDELLKAADCCEEFPRMSDAGRALVEGARVVLDLRRCLLSGCDWEDAATWADLALFLENLTDFEQQELEEVRAARDEMGDMRANTEEATRAQLQLGRSLRPRGAEGKGGGEWSHEGIATEALTSALQQLRAFPRVSDVGNQLGAEADVALKVRTALLQCNWADAATWSPLASLLDAVKGEERDFDEFREARREFADKREATEAAVTAALATGASARVAAGAAGGQQPKAWDHSAIDATALTAALQQLKAFPRMSDEGTRLAEQAGLVVQLRELLLKAPWSTPLRSDAGVRGAWEQLASFLEGLSSAMRDFPELKAGQQELHEKRQATEAALQAEFAVGKSVRVSPGVWSHEQISSAALAAALAELEAFPRMSEQGGKLAKSAALLIKLRDTLLQCDWASAASWKALAELLEGVAAREEAALDEVAAAVAELDDKRKATEAAVTAALAEGGSKKEAAGGSWDHAGISTTKLAAALAELEAFPRMSEQGKTLAKHAELTIKVREALLQCDWAEAATWRPMATLLESAEAAALPDCAELRSGRLEFDEKRKATEERTTRELSVNCAKRLADGSWEHGAISVIELKAALAQLEAFPRVSDEGASIASFAKLVIQLREALMECTWGVSAGWTKVVDLLDGADAKPHADKGEVKAAQQEVEDMRLFTEKAVTAALQDGRAVKSAAGSWDHAGISTTKLAAALAELEAFPRMSEQGKTLAKQAAFVIKLREALLQCDWASAASWSVLVTLLDSADMSLRDLSEAQLATDELNDKRLDTEKAVTAALAVGASACVGTGKWSHEQISTAALAAALAELEAFPRMSEQGKTLAKQAAFAIKLREALASCDWESAGTWGVLAELLESPAAAELGGGAGGEASFGELREAQREFADKRAATEEAVRVAMREQRSTRVAQLPSNGAAVVPTGRALWDHTPVDAAALAHAADEVEAFPRTAETGTALLAQARYVARVRNALKDCEWSRAASWATLVAVLEDYAGSYEIKELDEVKAAQVRAPLFTPPNTHSPQPFPNRHRRPPPPTYTLTRPNDRCRPSWTRCASAPSVPSRRRSGRGAPSRRAASGRTTASRPSSCARRARSSRRSRACPSRARRSPSTRHTSSSCARRCCSATGRARRRGGR